MEKPIHVSTRRALASVPERSAGREHVLREVLASGASEGSSERALTVDEHRRPEAEKRSRLGRCVALVWVD